MPKKITATIAIPTYNGEQYLRELLTAVFSQVFSEPYEVLVIDSGSKDRTLEIIADFPKVRLHSIPNSEFGHGRTRNLAAQMASGEFMVYLSHDAVPSHDRWLEYMLEPFALNDKVACVFGKQIPRAHSDATTKREVSSVFNSLGPDHSISINRKGSLLSGKEYGPFLTFFSDVNSAVRRDFLLHEIPYRDVAYSEDQLLGKDVLFKGYLKAYTPLGSVFHSNEYSLGDYFYRKHDEHMGIFNTLGVLPLPGILPHIRLAATNTFRDFIFTLKDKDYGLKRKLYNIMTCWYRNVGREYGAYLVAQESHRNKIGSKYSLEARVKQKYDKT